MNYSEIMRMSHLHYLQSGTSYRTLPAGTVKPGETQGSEGASPWMVKPEETTISVLARGTALLGYVYDLQPKSTGSWSFVNARSSIADNQERNQRAQAQQKKSIGEGCSVEVVEGVEG